MLKQGFLRPTTVGWLTNTSDRSGVNRAWQQYPPRSTRLISVSFGVLFLVSRSKGLYMNALVFLVLIVGLAALGWLVWSYMQQNAKLLETRTVEIAGGLRFEAHAFSVEMHQTDKCIKVSAQPGTMQVKALQEDGTEHNQNGVSTLSLPAAGLSVAVVRTTVASDGRSAAQANTFDIVSTPMANSTSAPQQWAVQLPRWFVCRVCLRPWHRAFRPSPADSPFGRTR